MYIVDFKQRSESICLLLKKKKKILALGLNKPCGEVGSGGNKETKVGSI